MNKLFITIKGYRDSIIGNILSNFLWVALVGVFGIATLLFKSVGDEMEQALISIQIFLKNPTPLWLSLLFLIIFFTFHFFKTYHYRSTVMKGPQGKVAIRKKFSDEIRSIGKDPDEILSIISLGSTNADMKRKGEAFIGEKVRWKLCYKDMLNFSDSFYIFAESSSGRGYGFNPRVSFKISNDQRKKFEQITVKESFFILEGKIKDVEEGEIRVDIDSLVFEFEEKWESLHSLN